MSAYKDTDWQDDSQCKTADPVIFFSGYEKDITAAKRICASCPVRTECLQFAQDHGIEYGTFGGLTEIERKNKIR